MLRVYFMYYHIFSILTKNIAGYGKTILYGVHTVQRHTSTISEKAFRKVYQPYSSIADPTAIITASVYILLEASQPLLFLLP